MKSFVTRRTVSAGPIGVIGVPAGPFGVFHMPSTTGVVPLQWNCTFRPEICGNRPVLIAGLQNGENPFRNACCRTAPVSVMIVVSTSIAMKGAASKVSGPAASLPDVSNAETIGRVLYTTYVYFFQAAGLVLLVAMIGAIVLTLRHKPGVKRQNIAKQNARGPKSGMTIVDIKPGVGEGE